LPVNLAATKKPPFEAASGTQNFFRNSPFYPDYRLLLSIGFKPAKFMLPSGKYPVKLYFCSLMGIFMAYHQGKPQNAKLPRSSP
jgi:hypothetical protein